MRPRIRERGLREDPSPLFIVSNKNKNTWTTLIYIFLEDNNFNLMVFLWVKLKNLRLVCFYIHLNTIFLMEISIFSLKKKKV